MSKIDVQVIYALQRAQSRLEDEARVLHEAHDYSAEFPANDAEQIGKAIDLLRTHPQPNAGVVTDQHPVIKFVLGEGELDGYWFGEDRPDRRGHYWWRTDLRAALSAAPTPPCTIVRSADRSQAKLAPCCACVPGEEYEAVGACNPPLPGACDEN